MTKTPGDVRATRIDMARVYLAQARVARRHGDWHAKLLQWAAQRRKAAQGPTLLGDARGQGKLL
jgi:hypothetical protein